MQGAAKQDEAAAGTGRDQGVLAELGRCLRDTRTVLARIGRDPRNSLAIAELIHFGHRIADLDGPLRSAPHLIAIGEERERDRAAAQARQRARHAAPGKRLLRAVPVAAAAGAALKTAFTAVTAHRAATASLALAASVVTAGGLTLAVQPYQTQTVPPQPAVTQAAALAPAAAFPSAVPAVVTHKRRHRPRRAVTSPAPQPSTAPPPSSPPPSPSASPSPGVLAVSSPVLQLEGGTGEVALTAQGGQVSWEASAPGWVFLSPASGSLADGETVTVTVTCHREGPGSAVVTFAPGVAVQVTWGG
ncbi:MAG TPA: hypothetical protein VFB06_11120 [Streptosporangiaceae bacterium]|nr:hypothetical protein [Streptosporangiaceae bacterium]